VYVVFVLGQGDDLLSGICRLVFAVWYLPSGICCLVFAVWYLPSGICRLAFAVSRSLPLVFVHLAFARLALAFARFALAFVVSSRSRLDNAQ